MSESVYLQRDGHIAWLVLNRPDKHNAISLSMWRAMPPLLQEAADDPGIRVLVMRGNGTAFSSGADIAEFEEHRLDPDRARAYDEVAHRCGRVLASLSKPTMAMVQGACVGGGCELALACDLRISDRSGRFGITPARIGLVYSLAAMKRLVDLVGPSTAKLILFSGELFDPGQAHAIRLIDEVVDGDRLEERVRELAATIGSRAQFSVRSAKRIIDLVLNGTCADTPETHGLADAAYRSADYQEGVRAFLEKRTPHFRDS